ncbi:hypothetical protein [Streptosporangium pseudovulgare]|uniref:hypothetical protein n=1 Tax=Streptosporangium pseudovulgare TaxID=35765 RepID=UPI00166F8E7E|nr:hypothetical protein [Streptosporangium pseudovulgare]
MPDPSVVTTVISTVGTLLGALGGVALTQGTTARRERRQAERDRRDRRRDELRQACANLSESAAQLRMTIEIAAQRHWRDMDVRLGAVQEHATATGLHAAQVSLAAPEEVASAAVALAESAGRSAAAAVKSIDLAFQDDVCLGGQMRSAPDLRDLDARLTAFQLAARREVTGGPEAGNTPDLGAGRHRDGEVTRRTK